MESSIRYGRQSAPRSVSVDRSHLARLRGVVLCAGLALAVGTIGTAQGVEPLGEITQLANIVGDKPEDSWNNWLYPLGPSANPFHRPDHPEYAVTQSRARLGKMLFWDEQLSSDNTMACGTCHFPEAGGTDFRAGGAFPNGAVGSFGVLPQDVGGDFGDGLSASIKRRVTNRTAPTMIGAYVFNQLFWDLRAGPAMLDSDGFPMPGFERNAGLEDQAAGPPVSDVEMAHIGIDWDSGEIQEKLARSIPLALASPDSIPPDLVEVVATRTTYEKLFHEAFGDGGVTRERIAMAIAHYERTLVPNQAPIDLPDGMTQSQVNGFNHMKNNSFSCFACHSASSAPVLDGKNNLVNPFDQAFSDGIPHFIGIPPPGSFNGLVKTPTLRNLGLRKRFFHSGQIDDFDEVMAFYNNELPGSFASFGFSPKLTEAELAEVKDFLVNALTDPRVAAAEPPFDRPDLYSERVPFESNEFGSGTPGTGGLRPEILANSPALVGSPHFKVGVGRGLPGAPAVLRINLLLADDGPLESSFAISTQRVAVLNGQGIGTAKIPLLPDPDLIGLRLRVRWAISDPMAEGGVAFSNSAHFELF